MSVDLSYVLSSAKALIFDCDGTLVNTPPVYAQAWAAGVRAAGHEMPIDWYMARAGISEHALVASGGPRQIVQLTLDELGLASLFDVIVTIEDVKNPKPAPDLFIEAARRLDVPARDCLVFEDSQQGLEAARNAAMAVLDIRKLR